VCSAPCQQLGDMGFHLTFAAQSKCHNQERHNPSPKLRHKTEQTKPINQTMKYTKTIHDNKDDDYSDAESTSKDLLGSDPGLKDPSQIETKRPSKRIKLSKAPEAPEAPDRSLVMHSIMTNVSNYLSENNYTSIKHITVPFPNNSKEYSTIRHLFHCVVPATGKYVTYMPHARDMNRFPCIPVATLQKINEGAFSSQISKHLITQN
jgi:hypothetical protein